MTRHAVVQVGGCPVDVTDVDHRRALADGEAGFSLVESLVALSLAVLLLVLSGGEIVRATRVSALSRDEDNASALLMQQVEAARGIAYASLATATPTAGADTRVTANSDGTWSARLGSTGSTFTETLVTSPTGLATTTAVRDSTTFTVTPYVTAASATLPGSPPCSCKRISVRVRWTTRGQTQQRWTSLLIGNVARGIRTSGTLSLRGGSTSYSVAGGTTLTIPALVLNDGDRTAWTLTATVKDSSGNPVSWPFSWYVDANFDGAYQPATDTSRLDTTTPGTGVTRVLESGISAAVLAVATATGSSGQSRTVTLTATSVSDPTVVRSVTVPVTLS